MFDVEVQNLIFSYSKKITLRDISFDTNPGDFVGILGPNGSGKTTLLKLIAGILKPDKGVIKIKGKRIDSFKRQDLARILAFVTQELSPLFSFTVHRIIETGLIPHKSRLFPSLTESDENRIKIALQNTGLESFLKRPFHTLSAGEQRRVSIARALAQNTPIILVDEPMAHLDPGHVVSISKVLKQLSADGKTIIAAFHDVNAAFALCNKILFLRNGEIHDYGSTEKVLTEVNLERVYETRFQLFKESDSRFFVIPKFH